MAKCRVSLRYQHSMSSNHVHQVVCQRTKALEAFPKPVQPYHHDSNVDEAKVRHNGCDVDEDLLVGLQCLEIDAILREYCNAQLSRKHVRV